jgi:hypothetical protein
MGELFAKGGTPRTALSSAQRISVAPRWTGPPVKRRAGVGRWSFSA